MDLSLLRANVPSAKRTGLFNTESVSDALSQLVSALGPAEAEAGFAQALKPEVANALRKTMAAEFRARGPALKAVADDAVSKVRGIVDKVTRGVWFHGRTNYPSYGESFSGVRVKPGNVGEPYGLSLTAEPSVTQEFARTDGNLAKLLEFSPRTELPEFKKLQEAMGYETLVMEKILDDLMLDPPPTDKHSAVNQLIDKLIKYRQPEGDYAARVLPRFGAPPTDVILPAWKGEGTEWAQEILREVYTAAVPKTVKRAVHKRITDAPVWNSPKHINRLIKEYLDDLDSDALTNFNFNVSSRLVDRGYKGLLYSPQRSGEYELRMLDPSDVTMVDFRNTQNLDLRHLDMLETIPVDLDLGLHHYLAGATGKSSFMPRRGTLDRWNAQNTDGSSLRDIYSDIDWSTLLK